MNGVYYCENDTRKINRSIMNFNQIDFDEQITKQELKIMYSWNFNLIRRISLISVIVLLCNCGGGIQISADPFTAVEDEFEAVKASILSAGGVADIGIGRSPRRDTAKEKAKINGQKNLAQIFENKVQNVTKSFVEELGEGTDVEINEAFSSATKSISSRVLNGAITKKTKYVQEKIDGKTMYSCYVLIAIEPGIVNQSLMDEIEVKNKKTYERFRASQAFEEMDAAMKDYEAEQASK